MLGSDDGGQSAQILKAGLIMDIHLAKVVRMLALALGAMFLFIAAPRAHAQKGAELFKAKCVICHGQDATGNTKMGAKLKVHDLTGSDVQKLTDPELRELIAKGKNKMPAYEKKLSQDQIDSLVAYVRALGKKGK
jgi:cbb3-type cytochrome c oxidase subunit III